MDSSVQSVDPHIPNMDFNKFVRYFITEDTESQSQAECEGAANGSEVTEDLTDTTADLHVVDEEKVLDGGSLTSADSGIIDTFSKGIRASSQESMSLEFPTMSDTNQAVHVQPQKMTRSLKF